MTLIDQPDQCKSHVTIPYQGNLLILKSNFLSIFPKDNVKIIVVFGLLYYLIIMMLITNNVKIMLIMLIMLIMYHVQAMSILLYRKIGIATLDLGNRFAPHRSRTQTLGQAEMYAGIYVYVYIYMYICIYKYIYV